LKNPDEHLILPEIISKEPMGPLTRHGDNQWNDVIRWVVNALIIAEEKGITQENVEQMANTSKDPEVRRMLGVTGSFGPDAGLPQDWAVRAIKAVGNYAEIYDRHLGKDSDFKMERGLNQLWNKGGVLYASPVR
jgi:general L-amino acid transport system substrate-binding protein